MDKVVTDFITSIEFGEVQSHGNMAVVPLFSNEAGGPEYMTLPKALSERLLIVTEIDEKGSIPELNVINRAGVAVLLLDGEELSGAKQNRVLNTTVLLPPESETVIPVSCTEQGRWFYKSDLFTESGVVMNASLRRVKAKSVTASLVCNREFLSDQDAVWNGIHAISRKAGFISSTEALKDVVESRDDELEDYAGAFALVPGQRGLFVFVNGKPAGFDMVSREPAYRDYHRKLVRSYAMDALLNRAGKNNGGLHEKVKDFLRDALCCEQKRYRSRGLGWDYRYDGEAVAGSCLVYEKRAVHAAFFSDDIEDRPSGEREFMSDVRTRKDHRRR